MKDEGGRRKNEGGRGKEEGGRRKEEGEEGGREEGKEGKEGEEGKEGGRRKQRKERQEEGGRRSLFVCLFVCCVWRVACGVRWVKFLVRVNSWFPRGKRTIEEFEKVEVREVSEKVNKPEKHRVNFSGS